MREIDVNIDFLPTKINIMKKPRALPQLPDWQCSKPREIKRERERKRAREKKREIVRESERAMYKCRYIFN